MKQLIPSWPRVSLASRQLARRYGLALLVLVAAALLVLSKADVRFVRFLGARAGDVAAPALQLLHEPLGALRQGADRLGAMLALQEENERLREENRRLLAWEGEALRLRAQNEALRELLAMPPHEKAPIRTTARILADSGGAFVQSRLIDAGTNRGVEPGMAVMAARGLLGRVVEVGERSARVLLLTDLNSRIPVLIDRTRDQAILEGDNSALPRLRFLPLSPGLAVGDRVLTSGVGGILPPGLLVGEIVQIGEQEVLVRPLVDWQRLDHVSVLVWEDVPAPQQGQLAHEGRAVP
ncbi:rod shape-determining protein MreC [Marinimicrococcus flavescens]|uniref:Cell shape-determining protein MreC n=1 Tax=Marinimicrococcus flavescens TaxID=3031815 RepID=A0AAP3XQN1_9PROT|nr:rod shape-determining protein MreC [Marinimicrococcus flavescens]